jgi:hypothetical protein
VLLQVKEYCERQWGKILAGRVSVSDFVFAKEVRPPRGRPGRECGQRVVMTGCLKTGIFGYCHV